MTKVFEQTFLQRRHTNSRQAQEKLLSIISHQKHVNQNLHEVPFDTHLTFIIINNKIASVRMWGS